MTLVVTPPQCTAIQAAGPGSRFTSDRRARRGGPGLFRLLGLWRGRDGEAPPRGAAPAARPPACAPRPSVRACALRLSLSALGFSAGLGLGLALLRLGLLRLGLLGGGLGSSALGSVRSRAPASPRAWPCVGSAAFSSFLSSCVVGLASGVADTGLRPSPASSPLRPPPWPVRPPRLSRRRLSTSPRRRACRDWRTRKRFRSGSRRAHSGPARSSARYAASCEAATSAASAWR